MAEGFSRAGVPVFCADVKGDLSGISMTGTPQDFLTKRAKQIGFTDYKNETFPAIFWDLFGDQGPSGPHHDLRDGAAAAVAHPRSQRCAGRRTQRRLQICRRQRPAAARPQGPARAPRRGERATPRISANYGNVATATIGAVQRALLVLEQQGGDNFFGEKALEIADLMRIAPDGRGYDLDPRRRPADAVAAALRDVPALADVASCSRRCPKSAIPAKPKLVFFFDEAHLLFDGAPKALVDKVEQVVKLIRSKGVGIYFITQNPVDIPGCRAGAARQSRPARVARVSRRATSRR